MKTACFVNHFFKIVCITKRTQAFSSGESDRYHITVSFSSLLR